MMRSKTLARKINIQSQMTSVGCKPQMVDSTRLWCLLITE